MRACAGFIEKKGESTAAFAFLNVFFPYTQLSCNFFSKPLSSADFGTMILIVFTAK